MTKDEYIRHVLDGYHATSLASILDSPSTSNEVYRKHFPTWDDWERICRAKVAAYVPGSGQVVDAGVNEGMTGKGR